MNPFDDLLSMFSGGASESAAPTVPLGQSRDTSEDGSTLDKLGNFFTAGFQQRDPTEVEPFNVLDVLGIGMNTRGRMRDFAVGQMNEDAKVGRQRAQSAEEMELAQDFARFQEQNQGIPPNQAVQKFLLSPEFAGKALRIPGDRMLGMIKGLQEAATPNRLNVAPGNTIMQEGARGQFSPAGTAPTRDELQSNYMLSLSDDEAKRLAARQGELSPGRVSDKKAGLDALLANGSITQDQYNTMLANQQVRPVPIIDPTNRQIIGYRMWDPVKGTATELPVGPQTPQQQAQATGAPMPGEPGSPFPRPGISPPFPGQGQPQAPSSTPIGPQPTPPGSPTTYGPQNRPRTRADAVDAAGAISTGRAIIGGLAAQIPGLEKAEDPQLTQDRLTLSVWGTATADYMRENREFKEEMERRRFLTPGPSMWDKTPLAASLQAWTLINMAETNFATAQNTYMTQGAPTKARVEAYEQMAKAQKFLAQLPPKQDLERKIVELSAQPGQAQSNVNIPGVGTLGDALRSLGIGSVPAQAAPGAPPAQAQPQAPAQINVQTAPLNELQAAITAKQLSPEQLREALARIRQMRGQ
jgi:hypothetical protein